MSRLTQSAAHSATQLFGTVTVAADSISTIIRTVGNAAEVLNTKSNDWLIDTKIKSAALAEEREVAITDEITFSIANRAIEREKILDTNPKLKEAYDKALARVEAAVKEAKSKIYT